MDWYLELNDMPFDAIKRGKKNRETRTKVPHNQTAYEEMKPGDKVIFTRKTDKEKMIVEILGVRHYPNVASMFNAEGQDYCMSYDAPRDEAIASYNQLRGYTEGIKEHGIWAIEVKPLKVSFYITKYPEINNLLEDLLSQIKEALEDKLVGLYLWGSLVWGDFDYSISDIDLLAATSTDITKNEAEKLKKMHEDFVKKYTEWDDRIEVAYISLDALKTFKTKRSQIGIISPGEPFHLKDAGDDWLINWYIVQEKGITIFGSPPRTIIDPISKEKFIQAVKRQANSWSDWIVKTKPYRGYQAYAILTLCRALYVYENGEQVSKKQAALWVEKELPEWSKTINNALFWRQDWRNKKVDPEA